MIKALIHTAILVGAVLVLAQFVPFVAAHEQLMLIVAVVIGLASFVLRSVFILILVALAAAAFYFFS